MQRDGRTLLGNQSATLVFVALFGVKLRGGTTGNLGARVSLLFQIDRVKYILFRVS